MWRSISAFGTVVLAALLSLVLAVPAHADASADFWANLANQQKAGGVVQHKYGWDYYKAEWKPTAAGQQALSGFKSPAVPVAPAVHPAATGPSWYLQQQRNRAVVPGSQPLTGKIIEPGKTLVRAPSTYAPVAKFIGTQFFGRALGAVGFGMGGTSLPPANRNELALADGVSAGCVDGSGSCSSAELAKKFAIDSCGQRGTCAAIGAVGEDGMSDAQQWFKDTILTPLDDFWAGITGQKVDMTPSDEHVELASPNGCRKEAGFNYTGGQTGTIFYRGEIVKPRPLTGVAPQANWDAGCSNLSARQSVPFTYKTECIDPATGLFANPGNGVNYGTSGSFSSALDTTTNAFKPGNLCTIAASVPSTVVPFKLRVYNAITEAQYASTSGSFYGVAKYSEWVNPDPNLNSIEAVEIETTWDCATTDGVTYKFTKKTTKTAAVVAPDCPPGSDLVKHEIKAKSPSGTETIDAGAAVPGAMAKYPDCSGAGCAMNVYLDGTVCSATRIECHTWPAINSRTPSRVVCKWGSYAVPTSDCNSLSNGYKTETGVVFDPKSGTWVGIDTYGNPVDANPEPWNPANPNPVPGATPGTPPAPGTGTGTPGFPNTGTSPTDGCVNPVWSWNPVDWVKSPAVCAMREAFEPKTDIAARSAELADLAAETAPISWISAPIIAPSGGGCPAWNITVPGLGSKNVVCESSFTAAITGARGPMFGIVATAMMWPLIRGIWYALIPIVRVTPSGSK